MDPLTRFSQHPALQLSVGVGEVAKLTAGHEAAAKDLHPRLGETLWEISFVLM